jgi:exopolysaccharide biosynthesis polyprenyl glycosylphosphotransferase
MTAEVGAYPPVASAAPPSKTRHLRLRLASRFRLGPCLFVCDVVTFGLVGLMARAASVAGAVTLALILATYHAGRLYRPRLTLSLLDDAPALMGRALAATAAVLVVFELVGSNPDTTRMLLAASTAIALLLLTRGVSYAAIREARRHRVVAHRTVIVGDSDEGRLLAGQMHDHPEYGLRPVGYLGSDTARPADGVPLLGASTDLARVVPDQSISVVVLALTSQPPGDLVSCVRTCDSLRCDVFWVPQPFELSPAHPHMDLLWGYPLMRRRRAVFCLAGRTVKRSIDVVIAALASIVALPLMAACALAVRVRGDGPVLFRQRRLGVGLHSFVMVKFRTLRAVDGTPERVGRFLRKYSLDELPQLFNVLRGDMSLVGPRPELPAFVDEFSGRYPGYRDRHRVKAGLTGWSQIHGLRGECSIEDRARFDNQYIENWSVWEDIKILLRTVTSLLRHRGK